MKVGLEGWVEQGLTRWVGPRNRDRVGFDSEDGVP